MQEHHFFPDTNFFVDFPDFHERFLFDDRPCVVVICTPVLLELDRLKNGPVPLDSPKHLRDWTNRADSPDIAFRAREAIRAINDLLDGRVSPPEHIRIERYRKRQARYAASHDEEIFLLAEQYAQQHKSATTILLTSDINLHNLAHGSDVRTEVPSEWQEKHQRERLLWIARLLDDRVREAHEEQIYLEQKLTEAETAEDHDHAQLLQEQLGQIQARVEQEIGRFAVEWMHHNQRVRIVLGREDILQAHNERERYQSELYRLEALGPSDELTFGRERFRQAYEIELAKVEEYEAEEAERRRQEAEERARREAEESERRRQEAEERVRREAELRQARRNKYFFNLADIATPQGQLRFPIETSEFEKVGEVIVSRYWAILKSRYPQAIYYDRLVTLHIWAELMNGQTSELLVISASDSLEYTPVGFYRFLSPAKCEAVTLSVGQWKIEAQIEDLQIDPKPLLPGNVVGRSPVFSRLALRLSALEITPDEALVLAHKKQTEVQDVEEQRLAQKRKGRQTLYWVYAGVAGVILVYVLVLLSPFLCCIASALLRAILTVVLGHEP